MIFIGRTILNHEHLDKVLVTDLSVELFCKKNLELLPKKGKIYRMNIFLDEMMLKFCK